MSANPPFRLASALEVCAARANFVVRHQPLLRRAVGVSFFSGTALVYFIFPTRNYYWDGISFAAAIETAARLDATLIHPHHLLYNVLGYLLYRLAEDAGLHVRAVAVLQFSNCMFSVICALLIARLLKRTLRTTALSYLLVAGFSFSATWWKYSTDADAYVLSLLCMLACVNLLLGVERIRVLPLVLAHVGGMCFHQLAVFLFPQCSPEYSCRDH